MPWSRARRPAEMLSGKAEDRGRPRGGFSPPKAAAPAPAPAPSKKKTKAPPVLGFASLSGDPLLEEARQQHAAKRQRLEASESGDASLGDRLAEMDALARRHEAGLRAADAAARDAADSSRWGGPAAEGDAASLAKVLDQAARCGDDRLMDTVLRRGESDVVEATLSRLPAASALPLLNNLAERLERRPRDAPRLVPWIQATLRHHAAHLANHPGARDALARLQHVVAERVHLLPKLLALQGKFDLLLRRAAAARAAPAGGPAVEAVPLREAAADPSDDEMEDDDDEEEEESISSSSSGSGDGGESSSGADSDVDRREEGRRRRRRGKETRATNSKAASAAAAAAISSKTKRAKLRLDLKPKAEPMAPATSPMAEPTSPPTPPIAWPASTAKPPIAWPESTAAPGVHLTCSWQTRRPSRRRRDNATAGNVGGVARDPVEQRSSRICRPARARQPSISAREAPAVQSPAMPRRPQVQSPAVLRAPPVA